jgi:hypothetical protein
MTPCRQHDETYNEVLLDIHPAELTAAKTHTRIDGEPSGREGSGRSDSLNI